MLRLLIENEKRTQSDGWVQRNARLEDIKKYHHLIAKLISGEDLMENLKNYRKKTLKEREKLKKALSDSNSTCIIF